MWRILLKKCPGIVPGENCLKGNMSGGMACYLSLLSCVKWNDKTSIDGVNQVAVSLPILFNNYLDALLKFE